MGLYETDLHAWAQQQTGLLRAGRFDALDAANIAEEIESVGKREARELVSRLTVLLMHLLKWRFQPDRRGASWQATIRIQRRELDRHLARNPSLKSRLGQAMSDAYAIAVIAAAAETLVPEADFPTTCPWTYDEVMGAEFWPE